MKFIVRNLTSTIAILIFMISCSQSEEMIILEEDKDYSLYFADKDWGLSYPKEKDGRYYLLINRTKDINIVSIATYDYCNTCKELSMFNGSEPTINNPFCDRPIDQVTIDMTKISAKTLDIGPKQEEWLLRTQSQYGCMKYLVRGKKYE